MPNIRTLERNRFSILTDNLTKCYACPNPKLHINEVYEGAKRIASMKYGCCIPLCYDCHYRFHHDRQFALKFKKECQKQFIKTYPDLDFISIFHRNYL